MKHLFTFLLSFLFISLYAQQRIDGDFSFQGDPAKKYALYIPSSYDVNSPNKLMLGLHPLNTNRWNAESWCDTLVAFAESNNLILVCPDGGPDGRIDDPVDTAFTTALLDSVELWYNIDTAKVYTMGFSWGGKTTYSYGLRNSKRLKGFIPIGAAVNSINEVNGIIANANGRPWYVVHGSNDAANIRYTPFVNALQQNGAILNSNLMNGVGHTIDFPNRNQILSDAFEWVDSVNCSLIDTSSMDTTTTGLNDLPFEKGINLYPNPIRGGNEFSVDLPGVAFEQVEIEVLDVLGKRIPVESIQPFGESLKVSTRFEGRGMYFARFCVSNTCEVMRVIKE